MIATMRQSREALAATGRAARERIVQSFQHGRDRGDDGLELYKQCHSPQLIVHGSQWRSSTVNYRTVNCPLLLELKRRLKKHAPCRRAGREDIPRESVRFAELRPRTILPGSGIKSRLNAAHRRAQVDVVE